MAFYDGLHAFLKGDGITFENDFVFSNYTTIESSLYHAFFVALPTAPEEVRRQEGSRRSVAPLSHKLIRALP